MGLVLFFLTYFSILSLAQPGGPGGAPGDGDPPVGGDENPVGVPLDGGTTALVVIGIIIFLNQKFNIIHKLLGIQIK